MEGKTMKYKIIVKNNETGEILFERDVNAAIAGLAGDDGASSILLRGTHDEMLTAMNVVQDECNRAYEE